MKKIEVGLQSKKQTEFLDITSIVQEQIDRCGFNSGIALIYCPHTTGAITINEGADPAVKSDIVSVLNEKIVPWQFSYTHLEGNSPAHVKSSLIGASSLVIVENGRLCLGTWQKIFFCEFDGPRRRKVWIKLI